MTGSTPNPILKFEDVCVSFAGEPVLRHVSFQINEGGTRVILGAAGSGKTVLLKLVLGLIRPDAGRILVFGEDITKMSEEQLADVRCRMGALFQEGGLFDSLSIEENVAYPLLNQKRVRVPPEEVLSRVTESLEFVELGHTLEKFPSELSGGMRRRVGIARAIVTQPPLLLYDSPTAGLDPITANTIMALIVKERDLRNTTSLVVTHRYQDGILLAGYHYNENTGELEHVAAAAGNNGKSAQTRFLVMREGELVFEGSREELEQSRDSYVSKFVKR